jgi:endoglucanase
MRPLLARLAIVALACLAGPRAPAPAAARPRPAPPAPAATGRFVIHRGTNISHWLSQSDRRGAARARFFTRDDVMLLSRLGFDHLRIPVDEQQLWDERGRPHEDAFALLDAALDWCAEAGLRAIVDLHVLRSHHFNADEKPLWTDPAEQRTFVGLWEQLSDRLGRRPVHLVAYELLNEAVAPDPESWNRLLAEAHRAVRAREPQRTIVIGSNMWQSVRTFDTLRVPAGDTNLILSFHFYTPMALTHYTASWTKAGAYRGPVRYPGVTVAEEHLRGLPADLVGALGDSRGHLDREAMTALLAKPIALARATGLPLYCGEWGALPAAPREDRLRWYADVRAMLDGEGIAWATWDYKGAFGLLGRDARPDFGLLQQLGVLPGAVPVTGGSQRVVFVVRHAEKVDESSDPDLSAAGHARAGRLADTLRDAGLTAAFATSRKRTQQTVAPAAARAGVPVTVLPAEDTPRLLAALAAAPAASAILVGAHSNTVPAILAGLGHPAPVTIRADEYDALFVVVLQGEGSAPVVVRLRY